MSKNSFYTLKVQDVKRLTNDCVELTFDVPDEKKDDFTYSAGQYLNLRSFINGEDVRRSYSLCTAPNEKKWAVAIKKIQGGVFSTFANEKLKSGDHLEVMQPAGNFIISQTYRNFVFFAAGSGITPIIAQIKDLLYNHPSSQITLIYGNKNFSSIIFREEIEALKNKFLERFAVHHIFTKEKIGVDLLYGRITQDKCKQLVSHLFDLGTTDQIMICGPNEMVFDVKEALVSLGYNSNNIHFELFNTEGLKKQATKYTQATDTDQNKISEITIQMDGDLFEFSLEYGGQSLLDAAIANGADLPYSCKGGVCSTCKAKITEGKVSMDINYSLEPYEVDAGYVLLCQAHPRTPEIYIDFDQK
jgi:ring-1,2-phenylacetyl-CoA epoxidase subunit PaaE